MFEVVGLGTKLQNATGKFLPRGNGFQGEAITGAAVSAFLSLGPLALGEAVCHAVSKHEQHHEAEPLVGTWGFRPTAVPVNLLRSGSPSPGQATS